MRLFIVHQLQVAIAILRAVGHISEAKTACLARTASSARGPPPYALRFASHLSVIAAAFRYEPQPGSVYHSESNKYEQIFIGRVDFLQLPAARADLAACEHLFGTRGYHPTAQ